MTHARQKGSLSRCHSFGRDQSRGWPRGEAMGRAWPERFLKEAGTKKGVGVTKKGQSKEPKEAKGERDRKHYPLRGRGGTLEDEVLSSPIQNLEPQGKAGEKRGKEEGKQACRRKFAKKSSNSQPSRSSSKTTSEVHSQGLPPASEPRKRRLASLNAEAVNSLLLEKAEVPPATKVAKKNPQDGPGTGGECSSTTEYAAQDSNTGNTQMCQSPKQQQQQQQQQPKKPKQTEKDDIDYCKIFAPTPRRLAGLNAAALLKLTSSSAASKQRVKTENKNQCASMVRKVAASTKTLAPAAKKQLKPAERKAHSVLSPASGSFSCKKGGFEPSPHWGSAVEDGHMAKVGYQSGSVPEYPLKQVKEEQVEAELSPYCCCGPPSTSLDYCCHRLGLFLRQQPAYPEAEEGPFAPVKQECLVPPPSLAHPSLALSTHHPCLCADHCFSSYYVHMAHARTPPLAALASRPLTYGPPPLCPGPVSGSKLIAPGIAHSSGIPHPPFCTSVRSPCYGESCRVSTYAYRALQPMPTRGCSFSTGCSRCRQEIKTEGYSSPRREHSPSLLQAPPAVPLSGCPLPQNTTPAATVSHLLSPLSERRLSEAGVGSGRECPQGSKPSNGSLTARRAKLSLKQQAPVATPSAKQKKVIRRRATNGWRPIGVPVEKEVFVVGEDEPALRQCFEGVQRDGEEIRVRDTVLLRSGPRKKSLPYVAKISALWEDLKTGEVMMSLFWYYRPEHTQGGKDPSMHCENEIFASKHQDVNSVACIEDKCYVLPLAQYCRYCALIKRQAEGVPEAHPLVPCSADTTTPIPPHRRVPPDVDPEMVYLCRHVYDFRYGRILKNLQ